MSVSKLIKHKTLTEGDISHVIQMAWEDRTSFETIKDRVGLTEDAAGLVLASSMKTAFVGVVKRGTEKKCVCPFLWLQK